MEPIYRMTTKYTFEEFKRFTWALTLKSKSTVIKLAILGIVLLGIGLLIGNYIFVTFAIVYPFMVWYVQSSQIKKVYNSNELMKDKTAEFEFYEEYLESHNPGGTAKVEYEKLYEIVETKTNMYLMIAKNQGFMLKKSEMPQGLEDFLREKAVWINAKGKK